MRFELSEFEATFPRNDRNWESYFPASDVVTSFLSSAEVGRGKLEVFNALGSSSMGFWVETTRELGSNMALGVQTGDMFEALSKAAEQRWNLGAGGIVSGVYQGTQAALVELVQGAGVNGLNVEAVARALGKAALGVALTTLSATFPPAGAVAALVAGGTKIIIRAIRERQAVEKVFEVPQNLVPASGRDAYGCDAGTVAAADKAMFGIIQGFVPLFRPSTAEGSSKTGLPSTVAELEAAAALTELTSLFLPAELPTGRIGQAVRWLPGPPSSNPAAPPGTTAVGLEDPVPLDELEPGALYVTEDRCAGDSRYFRTGIAREVSQPGLGWIPGRNAFSGPGYGIARPLSSGGRSWSGFTTARYGQDITHGISTWSGPESMFPACSSYMTTMSTQALESPWCFLVEPLEVVLLWRQWVDGFRALAERVRFEGGNFPGSLSRDCWTQNGGPAPSSPTSFSVTCGGGTVQPNLSHFASSDGSLSAVRLTPFFRQAGAWQVTRTASDGSEVEVVETWPVELDVGRLEWLDDEPDNLAPQGPWGRLRSFGVPSKVYPFRDPLGLVTAPGTVGKYGPVDTLCVEPWANLLRERQQYFLRTLQCAYVTQHAPAFRNASLRAELSNRREQLLTADARGKVRISDVLDDVGPDSYASLLRAAGVGKMGAFSLSAGPSQADTLDGSDEPPPFEALPLPMPPGDDTPADQADEGEPPASSSSRGSGLLPLALGAAGYLFLNRKR